MFVYSSPPLKRAYSAVPFHLRAGYDDMDRHAAVTENGTLVEIFQEAGVSAGARWVRLRGINADGAFEAGGDIWESNGWDLAPVDLSKPDWAGQAQRWRSEQRAKTLGERLPDPKPRSPAARF